MIDANNNSRIFYIDGNSNFTLNINNLTLANGHNSSAGNFVGGGAVFVGGNFIAINSTFYNNYANQGVPIIFLV